MPILKYGETQVLDCRAKKVRGLTFRPNLTAAVVNTGLTCADFLPQGIAVKVFLRRGNQTYRICQDNLQPLAMDSSICTSAFKWIAPAGSGLTPPVLTAHAVGVAEVAFIPIFVDFGGIIDLQEQDILTATITSTRSEYSANISTGASFVEFDFYESAGIEEAMPVIDVMSVNPNESNNNYDAGDCVRSITFINTDKTTALSSAQVVQQVAIDTDIIGINDVWTEAYTKTIALCHGNESDYIAQSLVLMANSGGFMANNVKINISFNSTNVNGGKNYVVARRWISSSNIMNRAQVRRDEYVRRNRSKLLLGSGGR